jgi:LPS export ABC transporter protein LptC
MRARTIARLGPAGPGVRWPARLPVLLVLLLLPGSAPQAQEADAEAAAAAPNSENTRPTLRLSGMTFVDSTADTNGLVLEAERVDLPPSTNVAHLETVQVRMRDPQASGGAFEMTCERGDLELDSSDFRAEGDVQGLTGDGRRFFTTWVVYDSKRHVVSTEAPVRILDGGTTLRGKGFRYHVGSGRFVLTGGARVVQQ